MTFTVAKVSVAPMMDWTDRHCRYFLRQFAPDVLLYTEMITAPALLKGDRERLLRYDVAEHPVALQLGGSEPKELARAARYGAEAGYDEINLNCGCPSDKVQQGSFGACLMRDPVRVAECVAAMRAAVSVPVTVKMRIGTVVGGEADTAAAVQRFDASDEHALFGFVDAVTRAGSQLAIVHARKAVLGGWSPKDNRDVPPLRYDVAGLVRERFAPLPVVINGGVRTAAQAESLLKQFDGVMLGREAYHRPLVLAEMTGRTVSTRAVLLAMADYAEREMVRGERLPSITRHMLGLLTHTPGARDYRRLLSEGAREAGAGPVLLRQAAERFGR